ncbi:MAG: TRAP transporter large permease subunit, partial [Pseudomonadota bacterium]
CAGLLMACVAWITWRDPAAGPGGARTPWPQRWRALRDIWGVAMLVVVVLGGIYGGVFTATEGAGIGASGAFFFALARRALGWRMLYEVLLESARTTAMLFTILIAAMLFSSFVNFTTMPGDLRDWILHLGLPPLAVVGAMMLVYVLLGWRAAAWWRRRRVA